MKLRYTLGTRNIVPPGGFRAIRKSGEVAASTSHDVLVRELRRDYPDETRQQLQQRVDEATCENLVRRKSFGMLDVHVPSLKEQGNVTFIPNDMLLPAPHNYNPGLFRWKDELMMCYRRHLDNAFSEIALAAIATEDLLPRKEMPQFTLDIPKEFNNEDHEDARIFWHDDDIYVSYTMWRRATLNGRWLYMPRIDVAVFDAEWQFKRKFTPLFGRNTEASEKNWTFFSQDGTLYFCYDFHPKHVIGKIIKDEKCELVSETPGISWDYGIIRGSTPPQRISDTEYLSFFHSRKTDVGPPGKNRYYAGAYCFEAKEPFRITRYTTESVFAGSEKDTVWDYSLACVFPCGLVIDGNTALVSMGSNDMECAIARVDVPELLEKMTLHES
jgi:predicted GH43/DUF377 family glycosyl hydrolase